MLTIISNNEKIMNQKRDSLHRWDGAGFMIIMIQTFLH